MLCCLYKRIHICVFWSSQGFLEIEIQDTEKMAVPLTVFSVFWVFFHFPAFHYLALFSPYHHKTLQAHLVYILPYNPSLSKRLVCFVCLLLVGGLILETQNGQVLLYICFTLCSKTVFLLSCYVFINSSRC